MAVIQDWHSSSESAWSMWLLQYKMLTIDKVQPTVPYAVYKQPYGLESITVLLHQTGESGQQLNRRQSNRHLADHSVVNRNKGTFLYN